VGTGKDTGRISGIIQTGKIEMAATQHIYNEISQFEPLMPSDADMDELEEIALNLTQRSANLANELPEATMDGVRELLRIINSYYSNLIEGHNTHPIDVERAMRQDYSADPAKRDRQIESLIHIDLQKKIEARLTADLNSDVTSADFLRWVHRGFYEQLPESLRWVVDEDGNREWVEAGEFRTRMVTVGKHLPPTAESIQAFLARFHERYNPDRLKGTKKFVAIAAAHHRLVWIHPFLDGNGRVARLATDAFFQRVNLSGYGLWNVSRGLARRSADYKSYLNAADLHREDDLDGRGNLSNRRLTAFCKFFLETCLDQAEYMTSVLRLNNFLPRLENYVSRRSDGLIVDEKGQPSKPLHSRAGFVLREAALLGEISRSRIVELVEMSERSARNVTKSLLDEGLLVASAEWHRSTVRLGFPPHAAGHWFPNLFPVNEAGQEPT
jgi:Fic family protein